MLTGTYDTTRSAGTPHLPDRLGIQIPPGPLSVSLGTPQTPGCTETFLMVVEVILPYLQLPLLSGSPLTRDVPTREDKPLLLLLEKPIPLPPHHSPPIPTVPPLLDQASIS